MGVMNKLMDLLGPKPLNDPKQSGARDYKLYKAEAEANGDEVMTPEAWAKKR
jgi:hypothetical protein